ncbi:MAG TPA: hypothetical protein PKD00_02795 [Burkholderiales bacterium]|nr:hypothetical protein [Burkholderiales bacterium]
MNKIKLLYIKIKNFKRVYGKKMLIKKILQKIFLSNKINFTIQDGYSANLNDCYNSRFSQLNSLKVYYTKNDNSRKINLVTDSINQSSLFGGVITAIIFTILLAKKNNYDVRIITRLEKAEEFRLNDILNYYDIKFEGNISFVFAYILDKPEIDLSGHDYFVTTSWWTTYAVLQNINPNKVFYLLQEDERMFYPHGDDYLLCSETLSNEQIKFIINSKLLYDHLIDSGLLNIKSNGLFFEPAFDPKNFFWQNQRQLSEKQKLFFYARPTHLRNIYYRGIKVIEAAIENGIINLDNWDIYFVGKDLPSSLHINKKYKIQVINGLNYVEYGELVRKMDLALCLMLTPHPSYPPLDLAASGAIVITNKFANKNDLSNYSKNIICVESDVKSLLNGLAKGVNLASDLENRKANYEKNNLLKSWQESFNEIINYLVLE